MEAQNDVEIIGGRVRKAREDRGLSQSALGALIGVSQNQVHKYETGKSLIASTRLLQVARVTKIPIQWFFDGCEY